MKKILVVHPQLGVIGGAEQVSIRLIGWIADRLDAEVSLLTLAPTKPDELIRSGLPQTVAGNLRHIAVNAPSLPGFSGDRPYLLKLALLHRTARQVSSDYDVCISTYNELDFGKQGVQYIHHPSFADRSTLKELNALARETSLARLPFADHLYRLAVSKIAGDSLEGFRKNITMVNSGFMKKVVEGVYGIEGEVVYPAFLTEDLLQATPDWDGRDFRFVSVGRVARDKNLTTLVDYYALLHREFPQAEFVIAGRSSDHKYEELLLKAAALRGVPLRILKDLPDQDLRSLLKASRFYVHSKINEHFGISIVEAAASGCLTLVHHSGSADEIVRTPRLVFEDGNDLVSKVKTLLDDSIRQRVLAELRSRLDEFTLKGFYSRLDDVVLPQISKMVR